MFLRCQQFWTATTALLLALIVAGPLGAAAASGPATPVAGSDTSRREVGSLTTADGRERTYQVFVPSSYDPDVPTPMVLVFHGTGGNAEQAADDTGFDAVAEANGFIAVYPDGSAGPRGVQTWNAGHCCGYAYDEAVDDVGFVDALIDHLSRELAVDPARIYATGMSNGGMLTYRLACDLSGTIAAIAVVSGTEPMTGCAPERPLPVLHVHGTVDTIVPYEGGTGGIGNHDQDFPPVTDVIAFWRQIDGCGQVPETAVTGPLTVETYVGCAAGAAVILYTIEDGDHAWPGGGRVQDRLPADLDLDATSVIWAFFAVHPMP